MQKVNQVGVWRGFAGFWFWAGTDFYVAILSAHGEETEDFTLNLSFEWFNGTIKESEVGIVVASHSNKVHPTIIILKLECVLYPHPRWHYPLLLISNL